MAIPMWREMKRILSRWSYFDAKMGDVVFAAPALQGQSAHSALQWRLKRGLRDGRLFISLRVRPDFYAGQEGSPTNYIDFDPDAAEEVRVGLELCIAECRRLMAAEGLVGH